MEHVVPPPVVMEPAPGLRWWSRIAVLFFVTGTALFSPVLVSWFSCDDFLLYATLIQGHIPFFPDEANGGFLRPMVGLSLWLVYRIAGLAPLLPHAFSVFIHIVNSLLVVKLALALQCERSTRIEFGPVAAGILFLALGCHGEAVAWISSLGDLLASFFTLLTLIQSCRALQTGRVAYWLGSMTCMTLALLSKESAFAAPLLVLLLSPLHWRGGGRRPARSDLVALLAHFALFLVYLLYRRWMIGAFIGGYGAHGHLRFYPDLVAQSLGRLFWRVFVPPMPEWLLAPMPNLEGFWAWSFLATLLVSVLLMVWRMHGQNTLALFCVLAFLAALLPVFNVRIYLSEMEGERYLYLPSVFAAMGVGVALARIPRARWRRVALVGFALFQAGVLFGGVMHWRGASSIARNIVTGIQSHYRGGTIILVNKPDGYKGALIFRTGLPEALHYFGPRPIDAPDVTALFAAGLYQWDHRFSLNPMLLPTSVTYRLMAEDPTSSFSEEDRRDVIAVVEKEPGRAVFQFREALHDTTIFHYDAPGVTTLTVTP